MHPNAPADVKPIALLPMTDSKPPSTIIVNRSPFAYFYWYVANREWEKQERKKTAQTKMKEEERLVNFCPYIILQADQTIQRKQIRLDNWHRFIRGEHICMRGQIVTAATTTKKLLYLICSSSTRASEKQERERKQRTKHVYMCDYW